MKYNVIEQSLGYEMFQKKLLNNRMGSLVFDEIDNVERSEKA